MAAIPTYRRHLAPAGLMTRRQLRAARLRPGGHDPVAQLRYWRHGWQLAFLYDARVARPIRPMTPGRRRTLDAMMRARRTCPACRTVRAYCIPRSRLLSPLPRRDGPMTGVDGITPGLDIRGLGRDEIPVANWLCSCGHHERARGRRAVIALTTRVSVAHCPRTEAVPSAA